MTHATQPAQIRPRLGWGILGVSLALSAPVVQGLLIPWFKSTFALSWDRLVSLGVMWLAVIAALGIAHFAEGYPLAAFGLARTPKPLRARLIEWIITVVAALVTGVVIITFSNYVRGWLTGQTVAPGLGAAGLLPAWVLLPAWITGAFTEEVLFRSYPIERLTQLTGRRWLAAGVTVLTFTFFHLFGADWIHVLTAVLPGGVMLTLFYWWRRNLALNVLIHAILNTHLLLLGILDLLGVPV